MGVDDPTQKYSNSSSGGGGGGCGGGGGGGGGNTIGGGCGSDDGKSCKKLKQKKVPQRGLGVAQLEKIRLEEQKKDAAVHNHNSNSNGNNNNNNNSPSMSGVMQVSRRNHHHPFPSSTNSLYRPVSSTNIDCLNAELASTVPLLKPVPYNNVGGGEIGWRSSVSGLGPGIWPGLWKDESNLEMHNHNTSMIQDQKGGLPILHHHHHSNMTSNLPLESVWPSSASFNQRTNQLLQQQRPSSSSSSSSMQVKVPYGISSSPANAMNFHPHLHPMEPPSNQSFYGTTTNDYTSFWSEEDKIVGMKRPYPFSLDNPAGPSFRIRYPPPAVPSLTLTQPTPLPLPLPPFVSAGITRSDDSVALPKLDSSSNLFFRENRHSDNSLHNIKKQIQAGRVDNGDFLSLAPPSTTSTLHTPDIPPEMGYLPCQGGGEELGSRQRQHLYNFFPCAKAPCDDPSVSMNEEGSSSSSDGGGRSDKKSVDLNLKL